MTKLTDEELEAIERELEARRATAEQEIVEVEELKQTVDARQGIIQTIWAKTIARHHENHFARDYEITMRTKTA